jgi:alpha-L-rhamnosidase
MAKTTFRHKVASNATNICISAFQIMLIVLLFASCARTTLTGLQTEYMTDPLGIGADQPRFSWKMESTGDAVSQSAYRITVAKSEDDLRKGNLVWDSKKTKGGLSVGISYAGKKLDPSTRYFWKVTAWDDKDKAISSRKTAWFETAADSSAWKSAQWIGSDRPHFSAYRARFIVDFDADLRKQESKFIFGYTGPDQYASVLLSRKNGEALVTVKYMRDSASTIFFRKSFPTRDSVKAHVNMTVGNIQYPSEYVLGISVDSSERAQATIPGWYVNKSGSDTLGQAAIDSLVNSRKSADVFRECRLYGIGVKDVSNVKISNDAWGVTLFDQNSNKTQWTDSKDGVKTAMPSKDVSSPMLRREFKVDKQIASARLYVTARGFYDFTINGKEISADYFNPGWTDYRKRMMYNTYDVTDLLSTGPNVLGCTLGSGWYTDAMSFNTNREDQYGAYPELLCHLLIRFKDGTKLCIDSDKDWKVFNGGPYEEDSWLNGVCYNTAKEINGWDKPKFDASAWKPVKLFGTQPDSIALQPYVGQAVRETMKVIASDVTEPAPHVYVYDFGQNLVGIPSVRIVGKKGQVVTLKYAEMTYPEVIPTNPVPPYTTEMYESKKGLAYIDNLRGALATDIYVCRGDKKGETFEPKFTSHGFRYMQIEGLDAPLPLKEVKAIVLNSIGQQTSSFECSDTNINRLFENILWSERGNFLSIPTDCPQRDERMGWTGDAQIFARSACYNMNVDQFYTRWMNTIRDDQDSLGNYCDFFPVVGEAPKGGNLGGGAMGWTDAGVIVPWEVYLQYGDVQILKDHYKSMQRFISFLEKRAVGHIQPPGGYGDWLAPAGSPTMPTNTAYSAYDAWIMNHVAKALGKPEDAARYDSLYNAIKEVYNATFINSEGVTVCPDPASIFVDPHTDFYVGPAFVQRPDHVVNTQTSYVVPLRFGLFDDAHKDLAVKNLNIAVKANGYSLNTGFIGTPYLCTVLSENGCDSMAFILFEQTEYPSWLYPVLQGATTIWERWNSYTIVNGFGPVSMNSFNHYSYGAIQEWMFAFLLGIEQDIDNPGYKHFFLQPRAGGSLKFATGSFESPYGKIMSHWERQEDGTTAYMFSIPANSSATLRLDGNLDFIAGKEKAAKNEDGTYELPSGTYKVVRK